MLLYARYIIPFEGGRVMSLSGYDAFSWLYHQHWDDYSDRIWPFIKGSVLPQIPSGSEVLDLCCGTGKIASNLIKQRFQVTGVDSSEKMLDFARANAPKATLLCQDARQIHLENRVHLTLSLFDSLNHMMTKDELIAVFERVWSILYPGGLFFFDMNSITKYESRWPGHDSLIYPDHVAAISTHYDLKTRNATFEAAIFRLQEQQWIRYDVHLTQKGYTAGEIHRALDYAGFRPIRMLDASRNQKMASFYGRLFFWAYKPVSV